MSKISNEEREKIYAALKLIESLHKQNLIEPIVYRNIMKEYSEIIDINEDKCYNCIKRKAV